MKRIIIIFSLLCGMFLPSASFADENTNSVLLFSAALKIGGEYYVYFDHYTKPGYSGAIEATDMKAWQNISSPVTFPNGIRHGTVLTAPENIVQQIQNP